MTTRRLRAAFFCAGETCGLQEPAGRHAGGFTGRHDQVVQHPDPDQLQRGDQLTRDGPISFAWLRHPAGVVMRQDAGAGVDSQGRSDDFPGVDAGAVQRAGEEVLAIQDPMAVIQPENVEFFVQASAEPHAEEVAGVLGVADAALAFELRAQEGFGRAEDVVFGDGAAALVVAVAVLDEAHVVLPRRGIAPWAPGRGARTGGQHRNAAAERRLEAGTTWTRACPCAQRSRSQPGPRVGASTC